MANSTSSQLSTRSPSKVLAILVALLTAVASGVAIYNYAFEKQTWSLRVEVLTTNRIIDPTQELLSENIAVWINGEQVQDPSSFTFRLTNTGNQPIRPEDVDHNLSITFDEAKPLKTIAISTFPAGVSALPHIEDLTVSISHGILNPGNSITFTTLTAGYGKIESVIFRSINIDSPDFVEFRPTEASSSSRLFSNPTFALSLTVMILTLCAVVLFGIILSAVIEKIFRKLAKWLILNTQLFRMHQDIWENTRLAVTPESIASKLAFAIPRILSQYQVRNFDVDFSWITNIDAIRLKLINSGTDPEFVDMRAEAIQQHLINACPDAIANAYKFHSPSSFRTIVRDTIKSGFKSGDLKIQSESILADVDRYVASKIVKAR